MKTSKNKIVIAARDLMRDKGYTGTSMQDVANVVGLKKGSLYSHFPGKDALVPEVLTLTFSEIFGDIKATGNWRADYERTLNRLINVLTSNRRCVGMHLAYGLDDSAPVLHDAVAEFFGAISGLFHDLIRQGVPDPQAHTLSVDTLTAVEGATLWLALHGDTQPIQRARTALLDRANSLAVDTPCEKVRALLTRMVGDWQQASMVEKCLAERLIDAEDELISLRGALAGQAEAEACFR
ncbi:TetR/AcrR family transcriptional regulator [Sagittula sp. NFXS13]|uniref:TetR/AcrR family transcriptional regulator n=1 Tax=Sagittula sp. NFXS13 TaxID=2819095 RepID=UPI0032DE7E75